MDAHFPTENVRTPSQANTAQFLLQRCAQTGQAQRKDCEHFLVVLRKGTPADSLRPEACVPFRYRGIVYYGMTPHFVAELCLAEGQRPPILDHEVYEAEWMMSRQGAPSMIQSEESYIPSISASYTAENWSMREARRVTHCMSYRHTGQDQKGAHAMRK